MEIDEIKQYIPIKEFGIHPDPERFGGIAYGYGNKLFIFRSGKLSYYEIYVKFSNEIPSVQEIVTFFKNQFDNPRFL
jgi:hypothetical protein